MNDDNIHEKLQQPAQLPENDPEVDAYREVFDFLSRPEDGHEAPAGFAHRVTGRLEQPSNSSVRLWIPLTAGIFALLVLSLLGFGLLFGWQQVALINTMTNRLLIMLGITLFLSGVYYLLQKKYLRNT